MNRISKESLKKSIKKAFCELKSTDGMLFDCPIEKKGEYDPRKLHEVCINHKLANHLEKFLIPLLKEEDERFFVDIEFNRKGLNPKVNDEGKLVRPDIIIHNRKSNDEKNNFLVVECKKDPDRSEISGDKDKLVDFLKNSEYSYHFALQVIYSRKQVEGTLFNLNTLKDKIIEEKIICD